MIRKVFYFFLLIQGGDLSREDYYDPPQNTRGEDTYLYIMEIMVSHGYRLFAMSHNNKKQDKKTRYISIYRLGRKV